MKRMGLILVEVRRVKYIFLFERKWFIYVRFYKCFFLESYIVVGRAFYFKW